MGSLTYGRGNKMNHSFEEIEKGDDWFKGRGNMV